MLASLKYAPWRTDAEPYTTQGVPSVFSDLENKNSDENITIISPRTDLSV